MVELPQDEPPLCDMRRQLAERAAANPLVVALLFVAAGIVTDRLLPGNPLLWCALAVATWSGWFVCWRLGRWNVASALLMVALAAVAGLAHHVQWRLFPRDALSRRAEIVGKPVCFSAVALGQPRQAPEPPPDLLRAFKQGAQARFTVRATAIRQGTHWEPAGGDVLLLVDGELGGIKAGDHLQIFGQLFAPAPAANPGEFDFAAHSRAERRLCMVRCSFPECIRVTRPGPRWSVRRGLDAIRAQAAAILGNRVGHSQSGLAAAVLLGAREQVDQEMTLAFIKTGTIHLLAISGLHVGMLAMLLLAAARSGLLPRKGTLMAIIGLILLYAAVTDARPSVVRAALLVSLTCVGWMFNRRAFSANSLAAAALVVLAMNPADLFRVGVQLSFLAVATLGWIGPKLAWRAPTDPLDRLTWQSRSWIERAGWWSLGRFWQLLAASAMVWLVTLPLVVLRFHIASFSGLLLNTLLWLPMALALLCGFATLATNTLAPPVSTWCGGWCEWNLGVIQQSVESAEQLPGSCLWTPAPASWWVAGLYLGLALAVILPRCWPRLLYGVALLVWIAVGAAADWAADATDPVLQERQLRATFLAIGHGTAVVLELPGGQTMLYDAGQLGSPQAGTRTVADFLWSRGIRRLDAIVISHADIDHYNAVPGLLERFSVGQVYVSPVMFQKPSPALDLLQQSIARESIPLREIYAGDLLRTAGPARIEVLHPPRGGVAGSDNANSMVLLVEFAGRRLLLPGDLETPGMESLLDELPIDCDLVMAPHHGSLSERSNPAGFVEWSAPDCVVISGGPSNLNVEVVAAFSRQAATVLHTAEQGAVQCEVSNAGVRLRTWNGSSGTWNPRIDCPPRK